MNNDLISRSALVEVLRKSHSYHAETARDFSLLCRDIRLVKEAPAVDAEKVFEQMGLVKEAFEMAKADLVKVVRCKDCQHTGIAGKPPFMFRYCRHPNGLTAGLREDDFCPYGERRADE